MSGLGLGLGAVDRCIARWDAALSKEQGMIDRWAIDDGLTGGLACPENHE
jgi:hypothetical protein